VIEAGIAALVKQLQGPAEQIDEIHLSTDGYRHIDQWSFDDVKDVLAKALPAALNALTRARRLTLADELSIDAASRGEALRLLPTEQSEVLGELDPGDDDGFARLLGDWTRLVSYRR
jgi:hypothetical protein